MSRLRATVMLVAGALVLMAGELSCGGFPIPLSETKVCNNEDGRIVRAKVRLGTTTEAQILGPHQCMTVVGFPGTATGIGDYSVTVSPADVYIQEMRSYSKDVDNAVRALQAGEGSIQRLTDALQGVNQFISNAEAGNNPSVCGELMDVGDAATVSVGYDAALGSWDCHETNRVTPPPKTPEGSG
jgi:hypothetical protein